MTDAAAVDLPVACTLPANYPVELDRLWALADGRRVRIRALRPDDLERELRFVGALSPQTLYLRVQYFASHPSRRDLVRMLELDYVDRLAIGGIVETADGPQIVGVSRYARIDTTDRAECAIVVADAWQGRGLGTELMRSLGIAAAARGIRCLEGLVLAANSRITSWARRVGFTLDTETDWGGLVKVTIALETP